MTSGSVAGVRTVEQANRYLKEHYLPWWNQHLTMAPANPTDPHRLLSAEYDLANTEVIKRPVRRVVR
jgi:hypothetical protein